MEPNLNPTVAEAPASPDAVPGIPTEPQATGMSQEEMRSNLQGMMSKIESKYQNFNSQKFATDNKLKEQEGSALRQIFDLFESMGVDPSNVEEVRTFLDKIKSENPELSQKLESVIGSIIGEEQIPGDAVLQNAPTEDPSINMNMNNETPQENI